MGQVSNIDQAPATGASLDQMPPVQGVAAEPVVRLAGVHKAYTSGEETVPVLRGLDLEIPARQFVVLKGVSGSGKSTLLHLIAAVEKADRGTTRVCGADLATLSGRDQTRFRAVNIGFVFQFFNLLPTLTAAENVAAALEPLAFKRAEQRRIALDTLRRVGLTGHADKYPAQLSGGQQQRVAIARAIAKRPFLILADEPTGNLDASTARQVLDLLRECQRETGCAVLVATHDPAVTAYADVTHQLRDGVLTVEA